MDKSVLREQIRQQRDALSPEEVKKHSAAITGQCLKMAAYQDAKVISLYCSKGTEVNTESLILHSLKLGKTVALPRTNAMAKSVTMHKITDLHKDTALGHYGIYEPKVEQCPQVPIEQIDLVITPIIAVDPEGNRLGYGLGYYDTLLAGYKGIIAALAYGFQIVKHIPKEKHDIPSHYIITEGEVIDCRPY